MAFDDDIAVLSRVALFQPLEHEALRLLVFSSERLHVQAGAILFHKEDEAGHGFVIISGIVELVNGHEVLGRLGQGALVGERALLTATRRPCTAIAREASTFIHISRQVFVRTLEEYPQAAKHIALRLQQQLHEMSSELANVRQKFLEPDWP